ncbi:MAG: OmpA family protein [Bacteroidota bacterium]
MLKYLQIIFILIFFCSVSFAQSSDFLPGNQVIFEDQFEQDGMGDLPAKWSTSSGGEVVKVDRMPGKWFKINMPTAVCPELTEALPENCTIEFDLYLQSTTGIAPHIMFGLTTLSDVSSGDVYKNSIWVRLKRYNANNEIDYGKLWYSKMGTSNFKLSGFVGRKLRVSIAVNKTRFRVYLGKQKIIDAPKLLTDDYRNNFFIASSTVLPNPEEGVYFSNVRIAATVEDARSVLIKQLLEQGSVVTSDIQFSNNAELQPESYPMLDNLGQAMTQDPNMNIQINGMEAGTASAPISETDVREKTEQIKEYLVQKYNIAVDRIITTGTNKIKTGTDKVKAGAEKIKNTKTGKAVQSFLTEIIKL